MFDHVKSCLIMFDKIWTTSNISSDFVKHFPVWTMTCQTCFVNACVLGPLVDITHAFIVSLSRAYACLLPSINSFSIILANACPVVNRETYFGVLKAAYETNNSWRQSLKAHFHPWCNAVVCFCFETDLLLNDALLLAIYFYRLVFDGKHFKLRAVFSLCHIARLV